MGVSDLKFGRLQLFFSEFLFLFPTVSDVQFLTGQMPYWCSGQLYMWKLDMVNRKAVEKGKKNTPKNQNRNQNSCKQSVKNILNTCQTRWFKIDNFWELKGHTETRQEIQMELNNECFNSHILYLLARYLCCQLVMFRGGKKMSQIARIMSFSWMDDNIEGEKK